MWSRSKRCSQLIWQFYSIYLLVDGTETRKQSERDKGWWHATKVPGQNQTGDIVVVCYAATRPRGCPHDPTFQSAPVSFGPISGLSGPMKPQQACCCVRGISLIAAASTQHRGPCHFFSPSLRKRCNWRDKWLSGAWPSCSVGWECLYLPPLFFSLVVCQAAINQAFIPGIKVTFRSRFHALMLWNAEWSGGGRQIERHWLGWGLGGGGGWSCAHNAVVVAAVAACDIKLLVEMIRCWYCISIINFQNSKNGE